MENIKKDKQYLIVVKPTQKAFNEGKRVQRITISGEWLQTRLNILDNDKNVERYFVEEIKY